MIIKFDNDLKPGQVKVFTFRFIHVVTYFRRTTYFSPGAGEPDLLPMGLYGAGDTDRELLLLLLLLARDPDLK